MQTHIRSGSQPEVADEAVTVAAAQAGESGLQQALARSLGPQKNLEKLHTPSHIYRCHLKVFLPEIKYLQRLEFPVYCKYVLRVFLSKYRAKDLAQIHRQCSLYKLIVKNIPHFLTYQANQT